MHTLEEQSARSTLGSPTTEDGHPEWCDGGECERHDGGPHCSASTTIAAGPDSTVTVRLIQHPEQGTAVQIDQFIADPHTGVERTRVEVPVSAARSLISAIATGMWAANGVAL